MKNLLSPNVTNFLLAVILCFALCWCLNSAQSNFENYFAASLIQPLSNAPAITIPHASVPDLGAKAALAQKISASGRTRTLAKLNAEDVLPIASLTKLMTAVVVLENETGFDPLAAITVSSAAANQEDVPVYGNLRAGDTYSAGQLMNLMLAYFFQRCRLRAGRGERRH